METKKRFEPAFPQPDSFDCQGGAIGMSQRLYIATMAMQGILASPHYKVSDLDDAEFNARKALMLADQLLKQEAE